LAVDVLPRAKSVAFLQHRLGHDPAVAPALERLADALGDLPLALEQAAAYLEATATTPSDYLSLLAGRGPELFALGQPATTEQTIATTWTVSLDRLREQAPAAEDLLRLLAFLGADDLARALPSDHPGRLPDRLAAAVGDPIAYQQLIGALRRYSLVATSAEALTIHRLVQAVVRHGLTAEQTRQWSATAARLVLAGFPEPAWLLDMWLDADSWPTAARLLPHALAIAANPTIDDAAPDATVDLLSRVADYLWNRAEYQQAEQLLHRAIAIADARLDPIYPLAAHSLDTLAVVLRDQGQFDQARSLHERALAIRQAYHGPDHPHTAASFNLVGLVRYYQGDLDQAQPLLERALAIREAHHGSDHPVTAASLDNVAQILHTRGDLTAARAMHERALHICQAHLGPNHPHTAHSLGNVALVLHDQGDPHTARSLLERALAVYEARLGPNHPRTAFVVNNLAGVLRDQGDLDHARALLERALAIEEARLGRNHPRTAWTQSCLALVQRDQGDLLAARNLLERALTVYEARLSADCSPTTTIVGNTPGRAPRNRPAARTLDQRALPVCESRLGSDHLRAGHTRNLFGLVLRDQGDLPAARTQLEHAVRALQNRLGPDHPETKQARANLAAVIAELETAP